jgi:signal transduction histidine kinase
MNTFKICTIINTFTLVLIAVYTLVLNDTIKEHRVVQDALLDGYEELIKTQDDILSWIN